MGRRRLFDRVAKGDRPPAGAALCSSRASAPSLRATRGARHRRLAPTGTPWRPIMQAYEARKPAYFATPPTNLILALSVGLTEILAKGMEARFALHERGARGAARRVVGARPAPGADARANCARTRFRRCTFPSGVDASLVARVAERGVYVAGGLHPAIRSEYFRVGHMGYALTRTDFLMRCVEAVAGGLSSFGHAVDGEGAVRAMLTSLQSEVAP